MRNIVHLAVNPDCADIWLGRKCGDYAARMREISVRRREAAVNGCDLIGVDRDPADKSVSARNPTAFRESFLILEIGI